MRLVWLAVVALVLSSTVALHGARAAEDEPAEETPAAEAPDPFVGCWTRVYDATHLAKHPKQLVTALTLAIATRTPSGDSDPGTYSAKLAAKFRDKPDIYVMPSGARCAVKGTDKDHLLCVTDGFFIGKFRLWPEAKTMKLAVQGGDQHIALVPGVDTSAFVLISDTNPEHALFMLQPAPAKSCGQ